MRNGAEARHSSQSESASPHAEQRPNCGMCPNRGRRGCLALFPHADGGVVSDDRDVAHILQNDHVEGVGARHTPSRSDERATDSQQRHAGLEAEEGVRARPKPGLADGVGGLRLALPGWKDHLLSAAVQGLLDLGAAVAGVGAANGNAARRCLRGPNSNGSVGGEERVEGRAQPLPGPLVPSRVQIIVVGMAHAVLGQQLVKVARVVERRSGCGAGGGWLGCGPVAKVVPAKQRALSVPLQASGRSGAGRGLEGG